MLIASLDPCSWREQNETIRRLSKDTRNVWDHKIKLLILDVFSDVRQPEVRHSRFLYTLTLPNEYCQRCLKIWG